MSKIWFTTILIITMLAVITAVHLSQLPTLLTAEFTTTQTQVEQSFGQLPLLFVENQGQWDEQVAYAVQGSDKTLYFTADGVTLALTAPVEGEKDNPDGRPEFFRRSLASKPAGSERWAVKLDFLGANPHVEPMGKERNSAVISYFKGHPDDWHAGLPTYRRLVYADLWPGIDLIYEGTVNRLKYHFIVHPGADPNLIRLAYRGASNVSLNDAGQLVVETPVGSFEDDAPVAYQEVDGEQVLVDMAYVLEAGTADSQAYHFALGEYDAELPLILDPAVLVYSGYIGGSGFDTVWAIAVDESGNVYVTGYAGSDENTFPVEVGPDLTYNDNSDAFVLKLNSLGTDIIYAGYLGGSEFDLGTSITVDELGNAYITGGTYSNEATFPVSIGPDLTHNGGYDAFVAKVNPSGTGLEFAGYIGGDDDEEGTQLAIDEAGNIYIVGWAESTEATFPVLVGPDLTYNGHEYGDAFITKVNAAGSGLIYSGYIGGSEWDEAYGVAVDGAGNAYVTGFTLSNEATFPVLIGPDLTLNGQNDAFVTKVNSAGTGLVYSGYIGGVEGDSGCRIALDKFDNAYIVGSTASDQSSFPLIGGPDLTFNGLIDVFITKVNQTGTDLIYSGYIGGSLIEESCGIVVDDTGNVYITGYTESNEFSFPVTIGPDLTFNGGPDDSFVAKLNATGTELDYAGYIGGISGDMGFDIAIDGNGDVYVGGRTTSNETTFPVVVGPDLTFNGEEDGFVTKVVEVYVPQGIKINGPITGMSGATYVFTATTSPVTTTLPLSYSWEATGQLPVTHTNGLTDTAVFTWNKSGPQQITVTAWNLAGVVTNTHVITLDIVINPTLYLPIISKA